MCLACCFLSSEWVIEALYESCADDPNNLENYQRLCDRLEVKKPPFLINEGEWANNFIYKLEIPMTM